MINLTELLQNPQPRGFWLVGGLGLVGVGWGWLGLVGPLVAAPGELGAVPPGRGLLRALRRLRRGARRGRPLCDALEPGRGGAEPVDRRGPRGGARLESCGAAVGRILSHQWLDFDELLLSLLFLEGFKVRWFLFFSSLVW